MRSTAPKKSVPAISVCIPTYRRPGMVVAAVRSVLQNGFDSVEVIVSDDDSDPEVEKLLVRLKDPRVKYFPHKRCGIQRNWTNALNKASAPLIMKLDDDDLILPGFLEKTHAFMHEHPDVSIVFTGFISRTDKKDYLHVDDNGFWLDCASVAGMHYAESILLNRKVPVNHKSAGVFRRSLAKKIGYFNKTGADIVFTIAMASLGNVGYIHEPLFCYNYHPGERQGMSLDDLSLFFTSMENLFLFPWIAEDPHWQTVKHDAKRIMGLVVPIMYIADHRYRYGFTHARRVSRSIRDSLPGIRFSGFFSSLVVFMPGRVSLAMIRIYRKSALLKKIVNLLMR